MHAHFQNSIRSCDDGLFDQSTHTRLGVFLRTFSKKWSDKLWQTVHFPVQLNLHNRWTMFSVRSCYHFSNFSLPVGGGIVSAGGGAGVGSLPPEAAASRRRNDHSLGLRLGAAEADILSPLSSLTGPSRLRTDPYPHLQQARVLRWRTVIWNIHNLRHQQRATIHRHWEKETECTHRGGITEMEHTLDCSSSSERDKPSPLKAVEVPLSADSSPTWASNTVACTQRITSAHTFLGLQKSLMISGNFIMTTTVIQC